MTNELNRVDDLVKTLGETLDQLDWMGRVDHPSLRPPATAEELEEFQAAAAHGISESYLHFLSHHNGMEGLDQYDWGIAGITPTPRGDSFEDVRDGHIYAYSQKDAKHPVINDFEKTRVVGSDFDYQVVYFDPQALESKAQGTVREASLRRVGLDTPYDHYPLFETFIDFLAFVVNTYSELLKLQKSTNIERNVDALLQNDGIMADLGHLLAATGLGFEPEPEPEPVKMTPEMTLASQVCRRTLELLLAEELIEFDPDEIEVLDVMEDNLLSRLLKAKSPEDAIERWISFLSRAREVAELYGTDDDLKRVMTQAFEDAASET
jgi:hypothetical protein